MLKIGDRVLFISTAEKGKTGIIVKMNDTELPALHLLFPYLAKIDGEDNRYIFSDNEVMFIPKDISEEKLKFLKLLLK